MYRTKTIKKVEEKSNISELESEVNPIMPVYSNEKSGAKVNALKPNKYKVSNYKNEVNSINNIISKEIENFAEIVSRPND